MTYLKSNILFLKDEYTYKEFGNLLGISTGTIRNILRNDKHQRHPTLENFLKIYDYAKSIGAVSNISELLNKNLKEDN